ncbi:MAG: PQQ-binding-like beta-propeller repeat protein [bacterium]
MLYFYPVIPQNQPVFHNPFVIKHELCSPIIHNNVLYQGLKDGIILSQDIENKRVFWQFKVVGQPTSVSLSDDKLVITTLKGFIYVLDNKGNLLWSYNTHKEILSKPLIINDNLYLQTTLDTLYAFNLNDGTLKWQYGMKSMYQGLQVNLTPTPYYSDNIIYTGFSNGDAAALDASSGKELWIRKPQTTKQLQDIVVQPAGNDSIVIFGSYDNGLFGLDKLNGNLIWERNDLTRVLGLCITENTLFATFVDGKVYRLDARTGDTIWKTELGDNARLLAPMLYNNSVLIAVGRGKYKGVVLLDQFTGAIIKHFSIVSGVFAQPTIFNNKIYVLSDGGYLYCFYSYQYEYKPEEDIFGWFTHKLNDP